MVRTRLARALDSGDTGGVCDDGRGYGQSMH